MFTFGGAGEVWASFQLWVALSLLIAVAIPLFIKKVVKISHSAALAVFSVVILVCVGYGWSTHKGKFHAVLLKSPNQIELTFNFPKQHVKLINNQDVSGVKFGMAGRGAHSCSMRIDAGDKVYKSQLDRDCDKVKKLARELQGRI